MKGVLCGLGLEHAGICALVVTEHAPSGKQEGGHPAEGPTVQWDQEKPPLRTLGNTQTDKGRKVRGLPSPDVGRSGEIEVPLE